MIGLRHLSGASRREARYGENGSKPGRKSTNNGLHQPGSNYKSFSGKGDSGGPKRARQDKHTGSGPASTCRDVLRDRAGAIHASIATTSPPVLAGRSALADRYASMWKGDGQVW